ncbi:unnamed protein product [Hymenolepis diminuta]|uniref:Uncharacterized protein n=1 Tax=Hymenolepis diminuta TaxID=6216 RepID=A0A564YE65_HYMDI|nr:unnamed protein product [Hymenolepis diminuta]
MINERTDKSMNDLGFSMLWPAKVMIPNCHCDDVKSIVHFWYTQILYRLPISSPFDKQHNCLEEDLINTHDTQENLACQTHLRLLNPSPPILYFNLRFCTEVCSIQPDPRNPWCSSLVPVNHQPSTESRRKMRQSNQAFQSGNINRRFVLASFARIQISPHESHDTADTSFVMQTLLQFPISPSFFILDFTIFFHLPVPLTSSISLTLSAPRGVIAVAQPDSVYSQHFAF